MQTQLLSTHSELAASKLSIVYARFQRSEPLSLELFEGFDSLRVVTYSASIPMIVKTLNRFESVECAFGFEGILQNFGEILACQKELSENILMAVKGLADDRKEFILEKVAQGQVRFFVVKDSIAHSKIYLLESQSKRRVVVGSANLSDRAFSGKQAETIIVFDDDEGAWNHYQNEYEVVRDSATTEFSLPELSRTGIGFEDIPLLQEARNSKDGVTVYVNSDPIRGSISKVVRTVEKVGQDYNRVVKPLVTPKNGRLPINYDVVGKIVRLVKSQKGANHAEEPTWLSIQRDEQKVLLSGKEMSLEVDPARIQSDVACLIEYFENFSRGFHGDVDQHQRDYFAFMCWLYLSPFVCDLRNRAIVEQEYIFDFPMFAVLYGKSNCGKTRLVETLMKSMFGHWKFMDKSDFTQSNLRGLLHTRKRFPIVFDDVDKRRFANHASDIIKDETFMLEEYPAFVLSMNAESHSFSTEVSKRCLMLYTTASLPDNAETGKALYKSVTSIQRKMSTALYREYLRRVLERLRAESLPLDMLWFSSEILTAIIAEKHGRSLPVWCRTMTINEYQDRKYERIRTDLLKLYETNPTIWEIRRDEVILSVPQFESSGLRKEIPDWLLKEGSRAGNIVLDRHGLEQFLGVSYKPRWQRVLGL